MAAQGSWLPAQSPPPHSLPGSHCLPADVALQPMGKDLQLSFALWLVSTQKCRRHRALGVCFGSKDEEDENIWPTQTSLCTF